MDNDPKHETKARRIAAIFGQKPIRWRPDEHDPQFLTVLLADGRKVHENALPPIIATSNALRTSTASSDEGHVASKAKGKKDQSDPAPSPDPVPEP